jgi:integrase
MKTRSGYLFQKTTNGTWYVRTVVNGRTIVKSTETRKRREAEKARTRIMAPFVLGDQAVVLKAVTARLQDTEAAAEALANPPPEIERVWFRFEASPDRPDSGPSTLKQYQAEWDRFERWLTANNPTIERIDQVDHKIAAAYAADLTAAKVSASTFNQHRNLLRMVWRVLLPNASNPWDMIKPHRLVALANRKRALTPAQFESLLAATECDHDLHDLLLLLAWTGLRLVDGVKLQWGAVDFRQGVIILAPQKTARRTGKEVHIPLFPAVRAMLDARQAGKVLAPARPVFPALVEEYDHDNSALSKRLATAFAAAGMETTEARADRARPVTVYGAHSLRHFFVTAASSAGMPAAMIKSITGHATDSMLEHYQQIGMGMAGEIAARIANGKPPGPPPEALEIQSADKVPPAVREALKAILVALDNGDIDGARARLNDIIT